MQLGYLFSYYSFDNRQALSGGTFSEGSSIYRNHLPYIGFTQQITSGISGSIQVGPNFIIGNPIYYVGGGSGYVLEPRLGGQWHSHIQQSHFSMTRELSSQSIWDSI